MKEENKEITIGEMIDNFSKMVDDCKKVNEDLQIKLKNKQSEIDYLKGQLSVYKELLKL